MVFAVDSEINTIIEHHLVSHYDICKKKTKKKKKKKKSCLIVLGYILFDSPLSSLVRHCLMREVSYQQSYLPLGN